MGQHRDDSKAEFAEGRTGRDEDGAHPAASRGMTPGKDPPPEGHGLSPVPSDDDLAEERTFSQSGGVGSQPGLGKRLATDEEEDLGHLDRSELRGEEPDSTAHNRSRGAEKHQP
jgi:hypothetical protein